MEDSQDAVNLALDPERQPLTVAEADSDNVIKLTNIVGEFATGVIPAPDGWSEDDTVRVFITRDRHTIEAGYVPGVGKPDVNGNFNIPLRKYAFLEYVAGNPVVFFYGWYFASGPAFQSPNSIPYSIQHS
ncbi:hypothetical protein ACQKP7_00525 [Pseudomonas frederiksbergensis]|uniref:hypothetical protein n=1 Tax=Pseudomonas frederiksbergensis TaxID=104087 RepID=UPI003D08C081